MRSWLLHTSIVVFAFGVVTPLAQIAALPLTEQVNDAAAGNSTSREGASIPISPSNRNAEDTAPSETPAKIDSSINHLSPDAATTEISQSEYFVGRSNAMMTGAWVTALAFLGYSDPLLQKVLTDVNQMSAQQVGLIQTAEDQMDKKTERQPRLREQFYNCIAKKVASGMSRVQGFLTCSGGSNGTPAPFVNVPTNQEYFTEPLPGMEAGEVDCLLVQASIPNLAWNDPNIERTCYDVWTTYLYDESGHFEAADVKELRARFGELYFIVEYPKDGQLRDETAQVRTYSLSRSVNSELPNKFQYDDDEAEGLTFFYAKNLAFSYQTLHAATLALCNWRNAQLDKVGSEEWRPYHLISMQPKLDESDDFVLDSEFANAMWQYEGTPGLVNYQWFGNAVSPYFTQVIAPYYELSGDLTFNKVFAALNGAYALPQFSIKELDMFLKVFEIERLGARFSQGWIPSSVEPLPCGDLYKRELGDLQSDITLTKDEPRQRVKFFYRMAQLLAWDRTARFVTTALENIMRRSQKAHFNVGEDEASKLAKKLVDMVISEGERALGGAKVSGGDASSRDLPRAFDEDYLLNEYRKFGEDLQKYLKDNESKLQFNGNGNPAVGSGAGGVS